MSVNRVKDLSERQMQCLELVARLQTTKQIAATLGIAPSTVDTHIQRAIEILGVRTRAEAAWLVAAEADSAPPESSSGSSRLVDVPIPTSEQVLGSRIVDGPRNRLTTFQRLVAAFAALILLSLAVAGLGAAIGKLSDWRYAVAKARNERGPLRAQTGIQDEERNDPPGRTGDPEGIPARGTDGERGGGEQRSVAGHRP